MRILRRAFHSSKSITTLTQCERRPLHFKNLVVGAGPAGVAVTSTLLDANSHPTLWIDPEFQGGRLAQYKEVPSNTKVKLFASFATTPLCTSGTQATDPLRKEDPEKGCKLGLAQEMVLKMTDTIGSAQSKVAQHKGHVKSLELRDGVWYVNGSSFSADLVFLATGSHPRADAASYPGLSQVPLDDALIPSRLTGCVSPKDTVCVVGSSHSAVLVLMNLLNTDPGPRVVNLHRSPLKYAEYLPNGQIILDNTGLKGLAAEWARQHLETGTYEVSGRLTRVDTTEQDPGPILAHCTKVVAAVGFERNALPQIIVDGQEMDSIEHDPGTGAIIPQKLYGFGIAFPEEVIDPKYGHKEQNVGLWKFMRYVRAALPGQQLCKL